jgi:hypothetical protein
MKRTFLKMPNRLTRFGFACYKTDAPDGTAEREALLNEIQTRINNGMQTRVSKEDAERIAKEQMKHMEGIDAVQLRSLLDADKGVLKMIEAQGTKIAELETRAGRINSDGPKTIRQHVAEWQTRNADIIKKIKSGESANLPTLEMRTVASPMTVATVNSGSSNYIGRVEVEPGVNDYPKYPNTFWDTLTKGRTNAASYVWVNKTNPQGAAAWIAPGVHKPGISFELVADVSNAKKIADSAKATTELLDDIDGMTTFIEEELRWQVMTKVNSTLMDSTASSTVPGGVKQASVAFNASLGLHAAGANNMDAIRAVVAQLRSGKLTGDVSVYINPIDAANMDMAKASTSGVYLLPPFVTSDGRRIAGATIIEDSNLPVGQIQAGIMRYFRILIYRDFVVSWGWENDDFTKNLVTAVGEMRLHQFVNQQYSGAFVRTDFATVIAALIA